MQIDRIKFSKEFFVLGGGEWCTMEAQLQENEDPCECIKELKQKMISMYGVQYNKADEGSYDGKWNSTRGIESYAEPFVNNSPKIINRAYERMEVLIGNCTTLEQLAEHKEFVNKNPDLMSVYSNKLKELTKNITV